MLIFAALLAVTRMPIPGLDSIPKPLPSPKPLVAANIGKTTMIPVGSCPGTGDYIRLKPGTVVLPKDAILRIEAAPISTKITLTPTPAGFQAMPSYLAVLRPGEATEHLKRGNIIMFPEPQYPNTGAGIKVNDMQIKPDGVYVTYNPESWISEKFTPAYDHGRDQLMTMKPWPEQLLAPTYVSVDPRYHEKMMAMPNIESLIHAVKICR